MSTLQLRATCGGSHRLLSGGNRTHGLIAEHRVQKLIPAVDGLRQ